MIRPPAAVDGRRLVAQSAAFGRALRRAGLGVDLGAEIDFARALQVVDIGDRDEVRDAGAAVFVRRRDDRPTYDDVFDRFWRARHRLPPEVQPGDLQPVDQAEAGEPEPGDAALLGDERRAELDDQLRALLPSDEGETEGEADDELVISPDAYSHSEVLRHLEFDRMTPSELRDAERLVDLLEPRLELRRTRRYELHQHGRRLAARAMFRRSLSSGGEIVSWVWQRQRRRPRPIVVICDISGSMERHSRLLLRFIQALSASSAVRTESFVFGTRLTRVTRILRDRDRDRALNRVSEAVNDWAGGTRIGESFREFNLRWARRTLRSSGIVIVVSDGWDRGDPGLVAAETSRLRRSCHRLVWLNPLAGTPGYQPLAAGMRAAYPYIDDFLPAGSVASLERLGEILAGVRAGDVDRSREAAAHVAADGGASAASEAAIAAPRVVSGPSRDPEAAEPLRRA
ncbi:MAG TPA: VWA domain-containing protein [Candidatus Limnocylindrales bacterium]|nr:VWA domain-containing protein [Candidatus Limnocylindrales bacterium]